MDRSGKHSADSEPSYESRDVHMKPIVALGGVLALVSVAAFVLMVFLFGYLESRPSDREIPLSPLAEPNQLPPEPRLQVTPGGDLEAYRRQVEKQLNTYRWIDKEAGVLQIPVERAMQLTAERGLPTLPETPAGEGLEPGRE